MVPEVSPWRRKRRSHKGGVLFRATVAPSAPWPQHPEPRGILSGDSEGPQGRGGARVNEVMRATKAAWAPPNDGRARLDLGEAGAEHRWGERRGTAQTPPFGLFQCPETEMQALPALLEGPGLLSPHPCQCPTQPSPAAADSPHNRHQSFPRAGKAYVLCFGLVGVFWRHAGWKIAPTVKSS